MIVTFYSFKGGVGRSMALVNVGEILAAKGYRVILCDWDLEAPGLERYLLPDDISDPAAAMEQSLAHKGLIDLLLEYKRTLSEGAKLASGESEGATHKRLGEVLVRRPSTRARPISGSGQGTGWLRLLSAGRRAGEAYSEYAEAIRKFDWEDFYARWAGGSYIEFFRNDLVGDRRQGIEGEADIVLIDSRTGLTEQGGVCTHHLADLVVLMSAANDLNLQGVVWMAKSLSDPQLLTPRAGRPLSTLPVAARIEQTSEQNELADFKKRFQDELAPFVPSAITAPREYLEKSEVPYIPFYSFRERVVAREPEDRRNPSLYRAYDKIAWAIVECGVAGSLLREPSSQGQVVSPGLEAATTLPPWDEETFLANLKEEIWRNNRTGVEYLCRSLLDEIDAEREISEKTLTATFEMLRRQEHTEEIQRLAEALSLSSRRLFLVRRYLALSLLEQGNATTALSTLELLSNDARENRAARAEIRGLIGRAYRQLYLTATELRGLRFLEKALNAYLEAYRIDPETNLLQGLDAVALLLQAQKKGLALKGFPDPMQLAGEILETIKRRDRNEPHLPADVLAAALEACLALGESGEALTWMARYVVHEEVAAFDLSELLKQLTEIWELNVENSPGSLLLPLLQSNLLQRRGGRVELTTKDFDPTRRSAEASATESFGFAKAFGKEGVVTLRWYKIGLDRARLVAKILNRVEDPFATGFLIRGGSLLPGLGDETLLLTNAHVVSNDPAVQAKHGALGLAEASIVFEAFEGVGNEPFKIKELLWTSPPEKLNTSLLRLASPLPAFESFPIAKRLPLVDGVQKVYIIGHPGGRTLSVSLNDNLLLDWDDTKIHYRAPTEGGSSGSPVFNQQWQLIGIHHAGSGTMPRLKGQEGYYAANEGIWIQAIIRALGEAEAGK